MKVLRNGGCSVCNSTIGTAVPNSLKTENAAKLHYEKPHRHSYIEAALTP